MKNFKDPAAFVLLSISCVLVALGAAQAQNVGMRPDYSSVGKMNPYPASAAGATDVISGQMGAAFGTIQAGDPTQKCVLQRIGCESLVSLPFEGAVSTKSFWSFEQAVAGEEPVSSRGFGNSANLSNGQQQDATTPTWSAKDFDRYIFEVRTDSDVYSAAAEADLAGGSVVFRLTPSASNGSNSHDITHPGQ
jgi:hypothetical protein